MTNGITKTIIISFLALFALNTTPALAGPSDNLEPTSDNIIDESETNDTTAQDLSDYFDLTTDNVDVLINGGLSDSSDIDKYQYTALANSAVSVQLNITDILYSDITCMQSAQDRTIMVTDNNTIWQLQGEIVTKITDDIAIADAIDALELEDVFINDLSVNDLGDIVITLNENVCYIDPDGNIALLYSSSDITTALGTDSILLSSVAIYDETLYFTDKTAAYLLKGDLSSSALEITINSFEISEYLTDLMTDAYFQTILLQQIEDGTLEFSTTTIASTTDTFRPTYMISVSGSEIYADGYYVSELSSTLDGKGTIDLISLNDEDEYEFSEFMAASDDIVHPTALAISDSDDFDNTMFMGNFDTMGNEFDGHVYKIDADGSATDFVTSYVDSEGNTATKNDEEVTGFYDVIDLQFPTDTDTFGNYLYVLSENIDDDTTSGSSSDIWRIDPNGVAELFVENVMDAAGRMEFDTSGVFDNKLIIAPWNSAYDGYIVTVDSDGTVENLAEVDTNILDIAVSPADSVFSGALLVTLSDGKLISIDYDPEDTDTIRTLTWATDLPVGDIPGGNILFGSDDEPIILCGEDKSIISLDYSKKIVKDITDIQIQPRTVTEDNDLEYMTHILVDFGIQPVILSVDESEDDVSFAMIEDGTDIEDDDTADSVGFCFSPEGHCYLYSDIGGYIKIAEWDQDNTAFGSFAELSSIDYDHIDNYSDTDTLSYPEIEAISVVSDSDDSSATYLYALLSNGINNLPEDIDVTLDQDMDDVILNLGNVTEENYTISDVYAAADLNSITLTITGPDGSTDINESVTATASEIAEISLDDLDGGDYIIEASSNLDFAGDYQLLVTYLGKTKQLTVDRSNPELSFTLIGNEQIDVTMTGPGQATFDVSYNPENGNVIAINEVTISGTNAASTLNIQNSDNPENILIESLKVNGSLYSLSCQGDIDTISTDSLYYLYIYNLNVVNLETMELPRFGILNFTADTIGIADPEETTGYSATKTEVNARFIRYMYINKDIFNINLFDSTYSNIFFKLEVDGRIVGSNIYCKYMRDFLVRNSDGNEHAMFDTNIESQTHIFYLTVEDGDLTDCNISSNTGSLLSLELENGSISNTKIYAYGFIRSVSINSNSDEDKGNILNTSTISSSTGIQRIYLAGEFEKGSAIGGTYATISRMICKGNFSGTLSAYRLGNLYVGYNEYARRIAEDDSYTGADFTGGVSITYQIGTIYITGKMRGDNSGDATISSTASTITMISIEDGAQGYIKASNYIGSIMVGMVNGNRGYIVNRDADVDLEVSTSILGRIYYTGELKNAGQISGNPLLIDMVK